MAKWEYLELEISHNDLTGEIVGYENGEPNPEHKDLYADWVQTAAVECFDYFGDLGWELIHREFNNTETGFFVFYTFKRKKE